MRHLWVHVVVLVLIGSAAACADDDGGPPPTTVSSSTAVTTTVPTTTVPSTTVPTTTVPDDGGTLVVQVFFLDQDAFNTGRPPYVRPVERTVAAADAEAAALDALFDGPSAEERGSGLRFVDSDATGIAAFELTDRTAHVTLAGGCASGGSTFTVADEIVATLVQFTSVDAVKIYDPDGQTAAPDEPGDSIPFCLEP